MNNARKLRFLEWRTQASVSICVFIIRKVFRLPFHTIVTYGFVEIERDESSCIRDQAFNCAMQSTGDIVEEELLSILDNIDAYTSAMREEVQYRQTVLSEIDEIVGEDYV